MGNRIWRGISKGFQMYISGLRASRGDPDAWESSIRDFETQDQVQPPRSNAILFTGSSSFTFWSTLEQDMAPLPVINRGFGGARMQDILHYADRVVIPYRPRAIVLFAGTNDIAWPKPATPEQVFNGYLEFVQYVQAALPETVIYYVSISPTPLRWEYWPIASEANRLIQDHTRSDSRLRFIDMTEHLLAADGLPNRGLYRFDRLHPNSKGYVLWTSVIKPVLEADFPVASFPQD
jgi:lysophospholipase L1-like esterase